MSYRVLAVKDLVSAATTSGAIGFQAPSVTGQTAATISALTAQTPEGLVWDTTDQRWWSVSPDDKRYHPLDAPWHIHLSKSSSQSIPDSTWTKITWSSGDVDSADRCFLSDSDDSVASPVNSGGARYELAVTWAAPGTACVLGQAFFVASGAVGSGNVASYSQSQWWGSTSVAPYTHHAAMVDNAEGTSLGENILPSSAWVWQSSGSAVNITAASFKITFVGQGIRRAVPEA